MDNIFTIRPIHFKDCYQVALVHVKAFPNSSLTRLGTEAVRRYYVSQMDIENDCSAIGAYQDDVMVGFIYAGIFKGVLTKFIRENKWFLIGRVIIHPWFAFDPMFRDAIRLAIGKLFQKPSLQKKQSATKIFVILALAVDPQYEKKGIGQQLLDFCENEAREKGFTMMSLTVNPENQKAIRLYQKNGWLVTSNYLNKNLEMQKPLTSND